jgi:hypothetical protein
MRPIRRVFHIQEYLQCRRVLGHVGTVNQPTPDQVVPRRRDPAHSGLTEKQKLQLIESISKATNSQTAVTNADRRSNEPHLQELQIRSFIQLGLFLERKRGEFADGVREGYLLEGQIVDRNTFLRCAMLAQGKLKDASIKKLAARCNYQSVLEVSDEAFREYRAAMHILKMVRRSGKGPLGRVDPGVAARAHACLILMRARKIDPMGDPAAIGMICEEVMRNWRQFLSFCGERHTTKPVFKIKGDDRFFDLGRYLHANLMPSDICEFFGSPIKSASAPSDEATAVS